MKMKIKNKFQKKIFPKKKNLSLSLFLFTLPCTHVHAHDTLHFLLIFVTFLVVSVDHHHVSVVLNNNEIIRNQSNELYPSPPCRESATCEPPKKKKTQKNEDNVVCNVVNKNKQKKKQVHRCMGQRFDSVRRKMGGSLERAPLERCHRRRTILVWEQTTPPLVLDFLDLIFYRVFARRIECTQPFVNPT